MTYEEAFNIVVKYGFCSGCRWRYEDKHCVEYDCYKGVQLIKEALEKQIPKKPEKLTYQLLLDEGWIYKCPNCGCACGENKYHLQVTADEIYCSQCGQKIDWE